MSRGHGRRLSRLKAALTTPLCHRSQQEAILEDLRTDVPVHFDFLFSDSHVEVISGKQEGTDALLEHVSR